jgi:prephenate dehydratase
MLASPEPALALANARAARYHKAAIVQSDVHDNAANETRFLAIGLAHHEPTGHDKTSICFTLPTGDRPGALYRALQPFDEANINLTRIESRPTKDGLGKYVFLLDMEGHCTDPVIAHALAQLQQLARTFRIIGSYPVWN